MTQGEQFSTPVVGVKSKFIFSRFSCGDGLLLVLKRAEMPVKAFKHNLRCPFLRLFSKTHAGSSIANSGLSLLISGIYCVADLAKIGPAIVRSIPVNMVNFATWPAPTVDGKRNPVAHVKAAPKKYSAIPFLIHSTCNAPDLDAICNPLFPSKNACVRTVRKAFFKIRNWNIEATSHIAPHLRFWSELALRCSERQFAPSITKLDDLYNAVGLDS